MRELELINTQLDISNSKARHLRLGDTKMWTEYTEMLTEDFVLDISQSTNIPIIRGRQAAVKQVRSSCDGATTVHQAHLPEFEVAEDEVLVTWAMHARVFRSAAQPSYTLFGYHHDRWRREEGVWKLAQLRQVSLHVDVHPPTRC